jgi:NTP pyrophosphatase (non-canonical NTP hydrolase)
MDADQYQQLAARTLLVHPGFVLTESEMMILWNSTGLAGEAGEVSELIKKGIFHRHGLDDEALQKELGDVMWYVAGLCTKLGFSLSDIMQANVDKLKARYPSGYRSEDSINRKDK